MTYFSSTVVAVTQRIDYLAERGEIRDALDQRLVAWLAGAGYLPVAVPNGLCDAGTRPEKASSVLSEWLRATQPGAILLSGGNDIGEYPDRDMTERFLLDWAQREQLPLLGICRGLQMMAVWAGTELVPVTGHVAIRHELRSSPQNDSAVWPTQVNSYHNWGLACCPEGFEVMAKAQDGTIEAIRHKSLPWQGWMWHPERESEFDERDSVRMRGLFGG